jgi:sulfate adenylyltransferase subunit 2
VTFLAAMDNYRLSNLRLLEAEAIHIVREVVAEFQRPVMLYSVGKDSSALLRVAEKAFSPGPIPFPLLHVDTSFKFREMYEFRDRACERLRVELIVHRNEEAIAGGANPWDLGTYKCCGLLKTRALLDALERRGFDAAFGGARRDEERSRSKERVFSVRDKAGQWDPRNQRPELWNLYNCRVDAKETVRVFPLSNWTETDVWRYVLEENIPVVPMYFARERDVYVRNGRLVPAELERTASPGEEPQKILSRFRSLGCIPCSGAIRSRATTVEQILEETASARESERATRVIDFDMDGSMEQKKREGYF